MSRVGLAVALLIFGIAGVLLGLEPNIDLSIARTFFLLGRDQSGAFAVYAEPAIGALRRLALWIEIALIAFPFVALAMKLIFPGRKMLVPASAILFLASSLILGPGLLVNVALKNHWGRPRPVQVEQFGGTERFMPWWQPNGDCKKNCSFVSGEASAAFWAIAPAALATAEWQPLTFGAAMVFGAAISFSRIATGGHFLSDTIFAGVFTFLVIWLTYALIYRRMRLIDDRIELGLERVARSMHAALRRMRPYFGGEPPGYTAHRSDVEIALD